MLRGLARRRAIDACGHQPSHDPSICAVADLADRRVLEPWPIAAAHRGVPWLPSAWTASFPCDLADEPRLVDRPRQRLLAKAVDPIRMAISAGRRVHWSRADVTASIERHFFELLRKSV